MMRRWTGKTLIEDSVPAKLPQQLGDQPDNAGQGHGNHVGFYEHHQRLPRRLHADTQPRTQVSKRGCHCREHGGGVREFLRSASNGQRRRKDGHECRRDNRPVRPSRIAPLAAQCQQNDQPANHRGPTNCRAGDRLPLLHRHRKLCVFAARFGIVFPRSNLTPHEKLAQAGQRRGKSGHRDPAGRQRVIADPIRFAVRGDRSRSHERRQTYSGRHSDVHDGLGQLPSVEPDGCGCGQHQRQMTLDCAQARHPHGETSRREEDCGGRPDRQKQRDHLRESDLYAEGRERRPVCPLVGFSRRFDPPAARQPDQRIAAQRQPVPLQQLDKPGEFSLWSGRPFRQYVGQTRRQLNQH